MKKETRQDRVSGLLVKHHPHFVRWKSAGLREASLDFEGYYLKVDGESESEKIEQLYLHLTSMDVAMVIVSWAKEILENGSKWAKFNLEIELAESGLKIEVIK